MVSGEMGHNEYVIREGFDSTTDAQLRELSDPATPYNLERALFAGRPATGSHIRPPDDDELGGGWAYLVPYTPSGSGGESGDVSPSRDKGDLPEFMPDFARAA